MSSLRFTEYENKRKIILEQLVIIESIAKELEMKTIAKQTAETIQQLEKDAFLLTIVGEFSRGKSMFINALMGEKVLPSKVKPTTAILNKIVYSEEPYIKLHFHENIREPSIISTKELRALSVPDEPEEDDAEELADYKEKVRRIQEINFAEIGTRSDICIHGVEIYDTPGVNDLEKTREDITYKFIPKSDAVILLLTAEAPLSKTEKKFLKDKILDSDISKVFIAVNFKDSLGGIEQVARVQGYVRKNLQDVLKDPKVFMISAKDAMNLRKEMRESENLPDLESRLHETGIPVLEKELGRFFQEERGNVKLLKPLRRGKKFSTDLIEGSLSLKLQALSMKREEVLKKIEELLPQVDIFLKNGTRIKEGLRANLKSEEESLISIIIKYMDRMLAGIEVELPNFQEEINKENMNMFISSIVNPIQKEMQQEIKDVTQERLRKHCSAAYEKLESETRKLDEQIKASFNLSLDLDGLNIDPFDDMDGILGGLALGSIGLGALGLLLAAPILIPVAIFSFFGLGGFITSSYKQAQRRKQLDNIKDSLYSKFRDNKKKAVASFSKEWDKIMTSALSGFEEDIQTKANSIKEELEGLLSLKRKEQDEIEQQKSYFEEQKNQLLDVNRQLSMINRIIQTKDTDKKKVHDYELV